MKRLNVAVICQAVYNSWIDVPDDMTIEEAIRYAKNHLNEVSIRSDLEYISGSDELDEENCAFEEQNGHFRGGQNDEHHQRGKEGRSC